MTWCWRSNHANASGNSVKMSISTSLPPPETRRSISIRLRSTSTVRTASETSGTSSSPDPPARSTSSTSQDGSASSRARSRPPGLASWHRAADEILGPPLVAVELRRLCAGDQQRLARAAPPPPARSRGPRAEDRVPVMAGPADDPRDRAADHHLAAELEQSAERASRTWKLPSSPCGRPTLPACNQPPAGWSISCRRCPRTRAGYRLAPALLIIVRSADAVRPPRPITLP